MSMLERVKNLTEKECIVDILRKELADNKCKNCGKCTFGYEGATQLPWIPCRQGKWEKHNFRAGKRDHYSPMIF